MLVPTRRDLGGIAAGLLVATRTPALPLASRPGRHRPVMLHVPGDHPSIEQALAAIAAADAAGGVRYEIRVADGHYRLASTIGLNLDGGADVHLIGNVADPARCVLEWTIPKIDGLVVADGRHFGLIDGFTIRKPAKAAWPDNATGILALRCASVRIGRHVVIENWYYGAAARISSTLWCAGISVRDAGDVGIWSYRQSTVYADEASSFDARDAVNGWGYGFQAEYGASLFARRARAAGCLKAGFAALSESRAQYPACVAENNLGSGFLVRDGGRIDAEHAIARDNGLFGAEIDGRGDIRGIRAARNGQGAIGRR